VLVKIFGKDGSYKIKEYTINELNGKADENSSEGVVASPIVKEEIVETKPESKDAVIETEKDNKNPKNKIRQ
jgi:hypothetical protein